MLWAKDSATDGGAVTFEEDYKYDAWGNRIQEDDYPTGPSGSHTTIRFALDGWNPPTMAGAIGNAAFHVWADLDGSNNLQTRYLRGDVVDQLFARIGSDGSPYWTLTDRLGSVRDVTDNNAAIKDTLSYDGWGLLNDTNPTFRGRYAWTGRESDSQVHLQYNRARYYDPVTQRWMSQDPLGFDAGDSNLYRYVRNKTTLFTDPSGLQEPVFIHPGLPKAIGDFFDWLFPPTAQPEPIPPDIWKQLPRESAIPQEGPATVKITEAVAPRLAKLGAFAWGVDFTLSTIADPRVGGFIVQHVTREAIDTGGGRINQRIQEFDLDFWEAIRVFPGRLSPFSTKITNPVLLKLLAKAGINVDDKPSAQDWFLNAPATGHDCGKVTYNLHFRGKV
jgi:RHS repeat-associated protein